MSMFTGRWVKWGVGVALAGGLLALAISSEGASASSAPHRVDALAGVSTLVSAGEGLKAPNGVTASVYTKGLPDVSDLAYDSQGRLWASATGDPGGAAPAPGNGVYLLARGKAPVKVLSGSEVKNPIGIVWAGSTLIVSNYGYIEAWSGLKGATFASHKVLVGGLAAGSSGWTDNGAVGPDGKVYLNVGAACDACQPTGKLEADVISFKPDGSDLSVYATRVRGNTFLEFMPGTDDLFGAMNQQNAVVPAPHDQLGIIHESDDWGFPTCYGQGGSVCQGVATEVAPLPVHNGSSAMALVDGQLGSAYGTSAFVTSVTTGDIERVELTKTATGYTSHGTYEFLTGLTAADGLILTPQHQLLVGNYASGTIYEISVNTKVNPGATATIKYDIPAVVTGTAPKSTSGSTTSTSSTSSSAPAKGTVAIAANPSGMLKYTQSKLTAKAGKVTIAFTNASPLAHDVVLINSAKKVLGQTPVFKGGTKSFAVTLAAGTYTYYCSVPGHREAGMQGTLTVTS